jgi:putative cell wall-binding protein
VRAGDRSRARATLAVAVAAVLAIVLGTTAASADSGKTQTPPSNAAPVDTTPPAQVSPEVAASVAAHPTDVVVSFDPSAGAQAMQVASAGHDDTAHREQGEDAAAASYTETKDDALARAGDGAATTEDFAHLPVQIVHVETQAALDRLADDPDVTSLNLPQRYHPTVDSDLVQIHEPLAAASGLTGAGVRVAVLDSGTNITAGDFGDCSGGVGSTLTGACRVTRRNVLSGNGTGDVDTTELHGTNVAGIVAKVAPGVRIDSYGVFKVVAGNLTADESDILNALNAVAADGVTRKVKAVNLSLAVASGPTAHNLTECTTSSFTSVFATLRSDGIVPVVAAGNAAYTANVFSDGVALPACTPGAVRVGAVYSDSFGSAGTVDCTDVSPGPGHITCFSQTGPGTLLSVYAPGAFVTAGGRTLSGTSQATPHVTGAIADLATGAPLATAAQLATAVTTSGTTITDTRPTPSRQTPLLDLTQAAAQVGATTTTTTTATTTATTTPTTTTPTTAAPTTTAAPSSPATVQRISGGDRIATSVAASQASFPTADSAGAVVIASAQTYPDGLAGTPLAVALHAPLLLTDQAALPAGVLTEVARVLPANGTVFVLGGTSAIGDPITSALAQAGFQPQRISGADRYATAAAIADHIGTPTVALLATGLNFPDALAAGVAAAHAHGVVLFTQGTTQASATQAWLSAHPSLPVVIVGGTAAGTAPGATSLIGADRYATSVKVAEHFFGSVTVAAVASGTVFPDALAGGAQIGALDGPMLLTQPGSLPAAVSTWFSDHRDDITTVFVYGGTGAVAQAVATQIASATA